MSMNTHRVEFELPRDPRAMRVIHDDAVTSLDQALAQAVPDAQVMHAIDPRRIVTFPFGGPPVWSVGVVSHPSGIHQFMTYGLSSAIDPAQTYGFELTMRVQSPGPVPAWPTLLLRTIARYHLESGRTIEPGQSWNLGGPISRAPVRAEEQMLMPNTRMNTILVVGGPSLPTPRGPIEIRNVFGLDDAECDLLESCRAARFVDALRRVDPTLAVTLDGPSLAANDAFRQEIEAASAREGSDCRSMCIPGLRWHDDGGAFVVTIPGGAGARLKRRLGTRLPFGEGLLVHDHATGAGTEVRFVPGTALDASPHSASQLVLTIGMASPELMFLGDDPASWRLRYA